MSYYLFGIGIIILAVTTIDLINTALTVSGAGFLSRRLAKSIWKLMLFLNRNSGSKKILEKSGAIILVSILVNWLVLIWLSCSLLFISQMDALVNVESNTETTVVSKIFYTGYTLSTLGLGDIEPNGPFWEVLTSIMSFTGLVLISIAITNLIPVVSAEIEKKRISIYITTLGCSVEEILANFWNGAHFRELEQPFINLTNLIILHAQNHKAYFVLHFFHSSDKKEAFVLNLANLDEVLTILLAHIPASSQPSYNLMIGLRKAISTYLVTLPSVFISPTQDTPPAFLLSKLEKKGIPIAHAEQSSEEAENLRARRRLLLALIKDDGWKWDDLQAGSYDHHFKYT